MISRSFADARPAVKAERKVLRFINVVVHYSSIQPVLTSTRTQMGSARRWSIVVLLCLGMVIAYVDRTALSVAIAVPDFRDHFGLDGQPAGADELGVLLVVCAASGSGRMAG